MRRCSIMMGLLGIMTVVCTAQSQDATIPTGPYPIRAAGWGPQLYNYYFYSRWAEDWTGEQLMGKAPLLKVTPIGEKGALTLSSELRTRVHLIKNELLNEVDDYTQVLVRGILGADLKLNANVRLYGEIGTGQTTGERNDVPNFKNSASLQQLFLGVHHYKKSFLLGAMLGRQEFVDGPKQLLSLREGPNLRLTWNGARLYAHRDRFRLGAFAFYRTQQHKGFFVESINKEESLLGLNASLILYKKGKSVAYLDPFWMHTENSRFRSGPNVGLDRRDSYGTRFWGQFYPFAFDWTFALQSGRFMNRDIQAWGVFLLQSLTLTDHSWKPKITLHIDAASGGNGSGDGPVRGFSQLYAGANYLGQGRFLSLTNLLFISPGISLTPLPKSKLSLEYGFAQRLVEHDAVYSGARKAYPDTQGVQGLQIGNQLRITGNWSPAKPIQLFGGFELFTAGDVLRLVHYPDTSIYGYFGGSFRF
ncbi:MAG: alginate export family protein [Bacteroidota bacterium]